MIERFGNTEISIISPDHSRLGGMASLYGSVGTDAGLPLPLSSAYKYPSSAVMNKQRGTVIKHTLNHITSNYHNIKSVKDAWESWKLHTSAGKQVILNKVNKSMKDYELSYIAKHGAVDIIAIHIKIALNRLQKQAFEKIFRQAFMGSEKRTVIEPLEIEDEDKERMVQQYQELLVINEKQTKDLEQAYDSLNNLHNRLNMMISMKFVKNLDKYRILNLAEAFLNISDHAQEMAQAQIDAEVENDYQAEDSDM